MRAFFSCLLLLASLASLACEGSESAPRESFGPVLDELVSVELWKAANWGREALGEDGYFAFPEAVRRVSVDVGAYELKVTKGHLIKRDIGVVAIEPMSERWDSWPKDPRVIGVPVAISLERGTLDFNVNVSHGTSSLLKTMPGTAFSDEVMKTVEVRRVPAVRLEDVLERIPPDLKIWFLKTDIQGLDLQALKSAGEHLRRVRRVRVEIINAELYEKSGPESMSTEQEFHDYMKSMGFSVEREMPTPKLEWLEERSWLDVDYMNDHWDG